MLKVLSRLLVSALVVDGGGGRNDHGDSCNFDTKIHSVTAETVAPAEAPAWVNERVQRLEDAIIRVREAPSALAGAFAGALVVQITLVAFYLLTAKGLSVPVFAKRCLRFSFVGSVLEHARRCCDVKLREVVSDIPW